MLGSFFEILSKYDIGMLRMWHKKKIQTRLIGSTFEQYLHSHNRVNAAYWFFNFESIYSHNVADQIEVVGQNIHH